MNYIELFAGCGGLSLGLKSVGFDLVMANELSPMAAESYAFNFFNEDLQSQAESKKPKLKKTLWLSSQFELSELKQRLRENPKSYPPIANGKSDIAIDGSNLNGSLVVGSIVDLNTWLQENPDALVKLKDGFGAGGVDLISGGPPCQSFSMAGLRKQDCEKNSLPWEFAKLAQVIQPKLVLLENVTGILRPFRDELGNSYYAWFELAKAFSGIGYIPLCLHVNAKLAGVPQNRPRFILLGVRKDFFDNLSLTFNKSEQELFAQPLEFFNRTKHGEEVELESLCYRDVSKPHDLNLFKDSFLKSLVVCQDKLVSVREAIDDLRVQSTSKSDFSTKLLNTFKKVLLERKMQNHEHRSNSVLVRRRFRLYQVLQQVESSVQKNVQKVLKGESDDISDSDWVKLAGFDFLLDSGKFTTFKNKKDFISFLKQHPTKKQTQKALLADQPAPAALSIPDDACHYHHDELRTLTVREMARIQSFPDNFEFRSKITTGGKMRSFEVPQYTQVGNAVPPLLGRGLALAIAELLERKP
ncbi:DNA cytosine methyltransferase [Methylotenera sp.]|uniref:DNA cytosine methyltransferase n=1 Tax=Methylotenera sp. TaxID=2051956 RepID=UPI0027342729|nr:DNA cytosine methyltransferase [Methylotenera sp.]MDP3778404.1 DNA cytosine methyltransferase [Methylotenera sp.]